MTPLVLSWAAPSRLAWTRARIGEGLAFAVLLLAATHAVFSGGSEGNAYATTFLIVPFIIWAAFRFTQREVATATPRSAPSRSGTRCARIWDRSRR